ncbi:MAG: DUF951 domain-containing protein [Chloroflexi bacterium]|nr:DUF951 domain-containing protein [Chloroflexota bacterium]
MSEQPESKTGVAVSRNRPGADIQVEDVVRLRKPHPCGSFDWRVVRVGADIGLRCLGCDHRVNLPRSEFERRFKNYIERPTHPESGA